MLHLNNSPITSNTRSFFPLRKQRNSTSPALDLAPKIILQQPTPSSTLKPNQATGRPNQSKRIALTVCGILGIVGSAWLSYAAYTRSSANRFEGCGNYYGGSQASSPNIIKNLQEKIDRTLGCSSKEAGLVLQPVIVRQQGSQVLDRINPELLADQSFMLEMIRDSQNTEEIVKRLPPLLLADDKFMLKAISHNLKFLSLMDTHQPHILRWWQEDTSMFFKIANIINEQERHLFGEEIKDIRERHLFGREIEDAIDTLFRILDNPIFPLKQQYQETIAVYPGDLYKLWTLFKKTNPTEEEETQFALACLNKFSTSSFYQGYTGDKRHLALRRKHFLKALSKINDQTVALKIQELDPQLFKSKLAQDSIDKVKGSIYTQYTRTNSQKKSHTQTKLNTNSHRNTKAKTNPNSNSKSKTNTNSQGNTNSQTNPNSQANPSSQANPNSQANTNSKTHSGSNYYLDFNYFLDPNYFLRDIFVKLSSRVWQWFNGDSCTPLTSSMITNHLKQNFLDRAAEGSLSFKCSSYSSPHAQLLLFNSIATADDESEQFADFMKFKDIHDCTELRRSYNRIVLKVHPDKQDDPRATEAFRKVTEAYESFCP